MDTVKKKLDILGINRVDIPKFKIFLLGFTLIF